MGMALFGAWALYAQLLVLSGANFTTLKTLSMFPLLGAAVLLGCMRDNAGLRPSMAIGHRRRNRKPLLSAPKCFWFVTPLVLVGIFEFTGSVWGFWILSTAFLFTVSRSWPESSQKPKPDPKITVGESMGLACICIFVVVVTLGANRPDADDAFLISLATAAIDRPDIPLYGFDNVYKSGMPLLEQDLHLAQSYEYFIALLADITKIRVHVLYYVVFPALWAPVGILVHWILLRHFLPGRSAVIGIAALAVLLVLWGDGHRTFGNFAFVRLFQGKTIFLLVALPVVVLSAFEYRNTPNWRNWVLLLLHQCAAMGLTANAVTIAPIASALVLLSGAQRSHDFWRTAIRGVACSVPQVLAGIGMLFHLRKYSAIDQESAHLVGYQIVLGDHRTSFVLLALLVLPGLSRITKLQQSAWLCSYLCIFFLLFFCPIVSAILGAHFASVASWRMFWCLPIPWLLSLAFGAASGTSLPRPWLRVGLLGIFVVLFAAAGPSTVNTNAWAWTNIGALKVNEDYSVARHIMEATPDGGLALVPDSVAINLCTFRNAPPLVAVRRLYLQKLANLVEGQDLGGRYFLLDYVGGETRGFTVDMFMHEVRNRGISTIAFRGGHPHADQLATALTEQEFRITHHAGHALAVKTPGNSHAG